MESYVKVLEEAILRYVGEPVLNRIKQDQEDALELNRVLVDATILFMDIRSFTQFLGKMSPDTLLDDLNLYFGMMSEIITRHHGFVDSLMGDAIFAIFGISGPHHADDACNAAMECLRSLEKFNKGRDSKFQFDIGIGINSGKVTIGNVGSKFKLKFTAVGDMVNLASRMEGLTGEYKCHIVLTEYTRNLLSQDFPARKLERVSAKGMDGQLMIYSLEA
jgi:adenylate cyclase